MNDLADITELLSMLLLDARTGTLIALLVAAAVIDWRTMRIPNWLTLGGMVLGLAINATHSTSVGAGLGTAASGLAVGLLLLLPLYVLRLLGAGDVKLMATVGAFLGISPTLGALLYVVVAGGVAALLFTASRGTLGRLAQNLYFIVGIARIPVIGAWRGDATRTASSVGRLPYGICICFGTIVYLVVRQLGLA
jgi:prepilin peptidase CpaA